MFSGNMFTRLDIYIFRQVLFALVVATGGLTALIWLTQSLRFVDLVVNRGLSLLVFLHLTGLLIPSFVAVILPITTYVVIQFVYQRMATDRELTVMRAAGLSPWALARPALAVALLATIAGYALSLRVVPASLNDFKQFQWEIRNRLAAFLLQDGVFTPMSDKLTVYIRSRDQDGTLHGILVDDARDPTAHATILAERGRLIDSPSGPRVLLLDGSRQEIDHQTGRLDMLTFKQNEIDLAEATKDATAPAIIQGFFEGFFTIGFSLCPAGESSAVSLERRAARTSAYGPCFLGPVQDRERAVSRPRPPSQGVVKTNTVAAPLGAATSREVLPEATAIYCLPPTA